MKRLMLKPTSIRLSCSTKLKVLLKRSDKINIARSSEHSLQNHRDEPSAEGVPPNDEDKFSTTSRDYPRLRSEAIAALRTLP